MRSSRRVTAISARLATLVAIVLAVVGVVTTTPVAAIGPVATAAARSFIYDVVQSTPRAGYPASEYTEAAPVVLSHVREESASRPSSARGASTTLAAPVVATEAAASAGSTGRTVAGNLTEQLAMEEVVSSPAGQQLTRVVMSDARWPAADGWVKMSQNVNGVEIHYVFNTVTKAVDDFKFIGGGG